MTDKTEGRAAESFEAITMRLPDLSRLQLAAKRAFDIVASGLILVVLSPLLILTFVAIKLSTRGAIFFVTSEHHRDNRTIHVLRFRCTRSCSVTFIGRSLISSGIDRLPMLINVLRGEMSIVGPRSHVVHPSVSDSDHRSLELHAGLFKPGLINPAEVMRGSTDTDLFYISNWSLALDAKIIVLKLLSKESYCYDQVRSRHEHR
jgi:lipopolysaccharide/colanic/teichoic acid biosynthesis glycosyltransferase